MDERNYSWEMRAEIFNDLQGNQGSIFDMDIFGVREWEECHNDD